MINTTTLLLYLLGSTYITVVVGKALFNRGKVFLLDIFNGNTLITNSLNQTLLIGYYLVNLGYIALTLAFWTIQTDGLAAFEVLMTKLGIIMLSLALMHYFNIYACSHYSKHIQALYENE